ncbi:MAG: PHP domain-containing protein [Clostridia bacterium]|nr:PHP domain-containing protein [Clostridia bacterium]
MQTYRADLHIHTLLSPCGSLEMSPRNIVAAAVARGLDIIGITDHNSTRHCQVIHTLAAENNIAVLCGAEVTSSEEVHCLAFMPDFERLQLFENYLQEHLQDFPNDPKAFGDQVQIDENEEIVYQEERLLIMAIDQNIDDIEQQVHALGGIFIPAHINRPAFGLISQLGFVPPDLNYDALELSRHVTTKDFVRAYPQLADKTFIRSSDAHYVEDIGRCYTDFYLNRPTFDEVKLAFQKADGRYVAQEK